MITKLRDLMGVRCSEGELTAALASRVPADGTGSLLWIHA